MCLLEPLSEVSLDPSLYLLPVLRYLKKQKLKCKHSCECLNFHMLYVVSKMQERK